MESRVHNSVLSNKQTDLAWRQLRASILCARAFSQLLLDERGEAAVRDVLKLNERIFRFAQEDRSSHPTEASRPSTRCSMTTDFPRSSGPSDCHRCKTGSAPCANACHPDRERPQGANKVRTCLTPLDTKGLTT
jgi:hypothetical protein